MFSAAKAVRAAGVGVAVNPLLNQRIVVENATVKDRLDPALTADIVPALNAMTGGSFSVVSSYGTPGVVRVKTDASLVGQSYRISASIASDTLIEGRTWRACQHGLYAWLGLLGCRRLAMGAAFLLRPSRSDLRLTLSVTSSNLMDDEFWSWQGTGSGLLWPAGTTGREHVDQRDEFMRWMGCTRSRYTSNVQPAAIFGGHNDASFITDKRAQLEADPDSFAQLVRSWRPSYPYTAADNVANAGRTYSNHTAGTSASSGGPSGAGTNIIDGTAAWDSWQVGERQGEAVNALHTTHEGHGSGTSTDYSGSTGVVGNYASWLATQIDAFGTPTAELADLTLTQSTAADDGAPDCLCTKCVNLLRNISGGTITTDARPSDKRLWMAGKIRDILAAGGRPVQITEYGYDITSYPPTPGWTINSNLFVQLANYSFQRNDGITNTLRLRRWGQRAALDGFGVGIYEYWSLPLYFRSDPRFQAATAWRRCRDWLSQGFRSFQAESPFSVGAVGIAYWGAFTMNWQGPRTYDSLMGEWCTAAFGAAASYMRLTLDRWWKYEFPEMASTAYELAIDFKNFHDADQAVAGDSGSRSRVAVFLAYLVFLHYKKTWEALDAGSPSQAAAEAAADTFLKFMWSTWRHVVVDCIWAHDSILASTHLGAPFKAQWAAPGDPSGYAAWRAANGIVDCTDAGIRATFETIRATYTLTTTNTYTEPVMSSLVAPFETNDATVVSTGYLYGQQGPETGSEFLFKVRSGTTAQMLIGFSSEIIGTATVTITNAEMGAAVSSTDVDFFANGAGPDGATLTINLATMTPGFYKLSVENQSPSCGFRIRVPRNVPLTQITCSTRPIWSDDTFGGWPSGAQPRYFFVTKNATHFEVLDGSNTKVRNPAQALATLTSLGDNTYSVSVSGGQTKSVWRWETSSDNVATPHLWGVPNWTAPTKEQLIVAANLWNE